MRRLCSVMWFLFALATLAMPVAANAQIIDITIAPPELPVYEQPPIPAPGYIWAPGYWAFDPDNGYYWVPGTWVLPPDVGLLWTPGYWGWRDGLYVWNDGYWGPQVGFYGGVDYGYGYGGDGYEGGYWDHGVFAYNRTVNNFGGIAIANVYERPVIVNPEARRVSFNGGNGGTVAQPTAHERAAAHERHVAPTAMQIRAPAHGEHQQGAVRFAKPRSTNDCGHRQTGRVLRQGCRGGEAKHGFPAAFKIAGHHNVGNESCRRKDVRGEGNGR